MKAYKESTVNKKSAVNKRAEKSALDELSKQSYLFYKLTRKDERFTTLVSGIKTKKLVMRPAVAIKLVVPVSSVLGEQIVKLYKSEPKKAARRGPRIGKAGSHG